MLEMAVISDVHMRAAAEAGSCGHDTLCETSQVTGRTPSSGAWRRTPCPPPTSPPLTWIPPLPHRDMQRDREARLDARAAAAKQRARAVRTDEEATEDDDLDLPPWRRRDLATT